jgi:EmrB/QacA subfamily drug resistance transporter
MAGVAIFTFSSVLIALAASGIMVIVSRGLQGFGASMIFATGMAILISVFPPNERGRVLGINVAAVYLGLSTGPFVGGIVTQYLGWRWLFWLNVPIGLVLLSVIATMLKGEWAEAKGARFDAGGGVMLALALSLTIYSFSELPGSSAWLLLAFGLLGLLAFVVLEKRRADPLVDIGLFYRNRVFAFSSLAALINYAATFAVIFLLSLYLQKVRGLAPREAGMVLVCQPLVQALLSPLAGRLSDKIEPRTVASVGMGLCFVGLVLLNFVGLDTAIYYIIGCQVILGFGFAFFSSPNTKAIMGAVDRQIYGVASAVVGTMRQVGMTLSMGIVMMILTLHLGGAQIEAGNTEGYVSSMRSALAVFAVMCFGGVFASLARGRTAR